MVTNLIIKAQCKALALKNRVAGKITDKENGDSQLVVALILVAVAIGLCLLFRTEIKDAMTDLFSSIGSTIDNLGKEAAAG